MSPNYEKEPPRAPVVDDESDDRGHLLMPLDVKAQRKLKQQRDFGKRSARLDVKPKFKQHGHHHHHQQHQGMPLHELRKERDLWLASQGQVVGAARNIPERRREKAAPTAVKSVNMSRSVPSSGAVSWPPASGVSRDDFEENLHPNRWAVADNTLSSSAPKETSSSYLSRSHGSKREARPMTLFESASFYNQSGNLLSHDNFEELGSSPDMSKRKPKRRVGRRKTEKAKQDGSQDALNQEEIVLELMAHLLPHVDVGKELNLLLLTGQPHGGDVFHFEEDDDAAGRPPKFKSKNAGLEVDLLKFQAALTKMVFASGVEQNLEGVDMVDCYFSEQWIAKTVLSTVKLDVLAQYDRFAVLLALFRAMHHRRSAILEAVSATALAIYHHQGVDVTSGQFADVECVSMKGLISFLAGIFATLELEVVNAVEIDESVNEFCDQICHAMKLLMRSSPGKPRRQDENNLLEKYNEDSESLEATTYGALGEVLYRLATFSPVHGEDFLRWMLHKWPKRNVQVQLFFVRFTGGLLVHFMMCGLFFPEDVVWKAFSRIEACIKSPHFLIAKEACGLCANLPLMDVYLSRDQALREKIASALHENARSHWNERIREMSDEHFDMLLDLA